MALFDDLKNKISAYFTEPYSVEKTTIVPSTDYSKLTFGNKGLLAEFAFLFVDIRKSSKLHENYGYEGAAKIYQSFHDICLRIIEHNEGNVRAFDGDRIMGVFAGNAKRDNAVKAAMQIRWSVVNILNKKLEKPLSIGCGIDVGQTLVTKIGKGRNEDTRDLIWIGQACNYASHLTQEANNSIIISFDVYNRLENKCIFSENKNMWNLKNIELKNKTIIQVCETTYIWVLY